MVRSEDKQSIVEIEINSDEDEHEETNSSAPPSRNSHTNSISSAIEWRKHCDTVIGWGKKVVHLERVMLAISVLAVLALVLFLCALGLLTTASSVVSTCHLVGCIEEGARLATVMNLSANPCEDFYEFACGRFEETADAQDDGEVSLINVIEAKNKRAIENYLLDVRFPDPKSAMAKLQKVYMLCISPDPSESNMLELSTLIKDIGGWSLFNTFNESKWNFDSAFTKLLQFHFISPILGIMYAHASNQLLFRPARDFESFLYSRSADWKKSQYRGMMIKFVKKIISDSNDVRGISVCNNCSAEQVVDSVLSINKAVLNFGRDLRPTRGGFNMTIEQVSDSSPSIRWRRFLRMLFGNTVINNDALINVPSKAFFRKLETLITKFNATSWNHYMSYKIIQQYVYFLGPEYDFQARQMSMLLRPRPPAVFSKANICYNLINHHMTLAVRAVLNREIVGLDNVPEATETFLSANRTLSAGTSWMSDFSRQHSLNMLGKVRLSFGVNRLIKMVDRLDHHYNDFQPERRFIPTYRALNIFRVQELHKVVSSKETKTELDDDMRLMLSPLHAKAVFFVNVKELVLPAVGLQVPRFHRDLPKYVNMASLGTRIMMLLHGASNLISDKNETDQQTVQKFQSYRSCLAAKFKNYKDLEQFDFDSGKVEWNSVAAPLQRLVHEHFAFSLLEREYLSKADEEATILPGEHVQSPRQQLYLSYAQRHCEVVYGQGGMQTKLRSRRCPTRYMVNNFVHNSRDFNEAFSCGKPSQPHNTGLCSLFD